MIPPYYPISYPCQYWNNLKLNVLFCIPFPAISNHEKKGYYCLSSNLQITFHHIAHVLHRFHKAFHLSIMRLQTVRVNSKKGI